MKRLLSLLKIIIFATAFLMFFCLHQIELESLIIPATYSLPILILILAYFRSPFLEKAVLKYPKFLFVFLFVVGAASRIYWNFFSGIIQTSDAAWYLEHGVNISQGKYLFFAGKQTGPAIMAALGLLLTPFSTEKAATFPLLLVAVFLPVLVFYIVRKLSGLYPALIGMAITVFWPEALFYSNFITASYYQNFFICLGYALWLKRSKNFSEKITVREQLWPIFAGISFGVAQYMRANTLFFLLGAAVVIGLTKTSRRSLVGLGVGFVFACLPILAHNLKEYQLLSFSPSQNSGTTMVIGTHFETKGHFYMTFNQEIDDELNLLIAENKLPNLTDMVTRNKAATHLALKRISSDPLGFLRLAFFYKWPVYWANASSLAWTFEGTQFQNQTQLINDAGFFTERVHRILVVLVGFALIFIGFRASPEFILELSPFIVGCLLIASVHLFAEIQSQYHVTILGFYPILAALGFGFLYNMKLREKLYSLLKYSS